MGARDTYISSVKSAESAKVATEITAEGAKQETINQSGCNVGYYSGKGGSGEAAFQAAVKSANQARFATAASAEQTKQNAINAARDTLRATGDLAPA